MTEAAGARAWCPTPEGAPIGAPPGPLARPLVRAAAGLDLLGLAAILHHAPAERRARLMLLGAPLLVALLALAARPGAGLALARRLGSRALVGAGAGLVAALALLGAPALALTVAPFAALGLADEAVRRPRRTAVALAGLALLVGLSVRVGLTLAVPYPLVEPDTAGYLAGPDAWLAGAAPRWAIDSIRTPTFPGFVTGALALTGSYPGVALATHALALLVAAGAAGVVLRRAGPLPAALVLGALWAAPRAALLEHTLMSEALHGLCLTAFVVLLAGAVRRGAPAAPATCVALGLATAAVALARPNSLATVALAPAALAFSGRRGAAAFVAAAAVVPLLAWCTHNALRLGFFGLTTFSGGSLFGVVGHNLDLDRGPPHAQVRAEMRAALEAHNARRPPHDPDVIWLMYAPEGPIRTSATLAALDAPARDRVLVDLAREALLRAPGALVRRTAAQSLRFSLAEPAALPAWDALQARVRPGEATHGYAWASPAFVDPPWARALDGLPSEQVYTTLAWLPARVVARVVPFHVTEQPLLFVAFLVLGWRHRRWRALLWPVALLGLSQAALCAVFSYPESRFRLQTVPLTVIPLALLLGARLRVLMPAQAPEAQPSPV